MLLRSIRAKFVIYITPVILFLSFSFLLFYIQQSRYLIDQALSQTGFTLSKNLAYSSELAVASEDEVLLKPYLDGIFEEEDIVMVTIYNEKGRIITSRTKTEADERMPQGVMEKLTAEGETLKKLGYSKTGEEIYSFFSPVFVGGEASFVFPQTRSLKGFTRVGLTFKKKVAAQTKRIVLLGIGITGLVVLLGAIILLFLSRKITAPIKQLIRSTRIIGKGDLGHRITIKTGDEIEELAASFNQMTRDLQQSQSALKESKDVLEVRVNARTRELKELAEKREEIIEQRTKQLQERVDELEKFHKLTVGRELKMTELKEEIKKLKSKFKRSV